MLATTFQLVQHVGPSTLPAWASLAILLILLAAAVVAATRWRLDVLGLAIGAVLTYAWVGLTNAVRVGPTAVIEQVVIIAVALAVTALAVHRRRRAAVRPRAGATVRAATHRA